MVVSEVETSEVLVEYNGEDGGNGMAPIGTSYSECALVVVSEVETSEVLVESNGEDGGDDMTPIGTSCSECALVEAQS